MDWVTKGLACASCPCRQEAQHTVKTGWPTFPGSACSIIASDTSGPSAAEADVPLKRIVNTREMAFCQRFSVVRQAKSGRAYHRAVKLPERMARLGTESAFEVLARAQAMEADGRKIIHLEIGEPDFPTAGARMHQPMLLTMTPLLREGAW